MAAMLVWAVLIGIVAQGLSSLGLVLMKRNNQSKTKMAWYKNGFWWLSFLVFVIGNISSAIALTLGSQSIISALPVLVLVYNTLWAPLILKEKVGIQDIFGVLVTVGGICLIILFGPRVNSDYNDEDLVSFFIDWNFIVYGVVVLIICCLSLTFTHFYAPKHKDDESKDNFRDCWRITSFKTKLISLCAALLPGILSSFNALFSKIIGELVSTTIKGQNQFFGWHPYIFIIALVLCNVAQVIMLQRALGRFSALQIIPMYQVCLTLFAVIGGGIYFHEFKTFKHVAMIRPILFSVGLLLALTGIFIFPKHKDDSQVNGFQRQLDEKNIDPDKNIDELYAYHDYTNNNSPSKQLEYTTASPIRVTVA